MAIYKSSHTGREIDSLIDNIAPAYSTDYQYKIGDLTTYYGVLYECQKATRGAWNANSWKEIKVSELLKYVSPDMVKTINDIKPDASGNINIELKDIPGDDTHASVSEEEKENWNSKATTDYADKHGPAPTKAQIITALGYTPYDASNPNGYATEEFVEDSISNINQVPTDGTNGQVLTKTSSDSGAYEWQNINTVPTEGSTGQVLTKTEGGYAWGDVKSGGGFIIQESEPTDQNVLWIDSTNRLLKYYDDSAKKWIPTRGAWS